MISIGLAQIPNSTSIEKNCDAILSLLSRFEKSKVDLVLFPECSLSGFSAKMKECTQEVLQPYLNKIRSWVQATGIVVVLPTAIAEKEKIFNSGFWITTEEIKTFYKLGLTDSEMKFFSVPEGNSQKSFSLKGYNLAILICVETELQHDLFFDSDEVDAVLWPGYWHWTVEESWNACHLSGKRNPIFENMIKWKKPLLQSNFAFNDLGDYAGAGPEGLSFVIDGQNKLLARGPHLKAGGLIVKLAKNELSTVVSSYRVLE